MARSSERRAPPPRVRNKVALRHQPLRTRVLRLKLTQPPHFLRAQCSEPLAPDVDRPIADLVPLRNLRMFTFGDALHAASAALNASLKDVADVQLAADPLQIDVLALIVESGVAPDHDGVPYPRQVGCEALRGRFKL